MKQKSARLSLLISGQVQGVGFRPFVWRLAKSENLTGFVRNTSGGVLVEIQGLPQSLASFEKRLTDELPPLARIAGIKKENIPLLQEEKEFAITESIGHGGQNVLVSPDVGICEDCLADIFDQHNRRYGYAFANCTNCGPRFSITRSIPYDRSSTCMACFPMCPDCAAEYGNPADRRFHAQPIACAQCGPRLWFVSAENAAKGQSVPGGQSSDEALDRAAELLLAGGILALKGIGGFQLVCDAENALAVSTLRQRKRRPHKALAVMAADIATVRKICAISPVQEKMLTDPEKPIVLCPGRAESLLSLCGEIAPDTDETGIMLPSSPLHALLLQRVQTAGKANPVLVMTSANPPGEPICLGNREALARLASLADGWLLHDRDILTRVDDSVAAERNGPAIFRRARGFTPRPFSLPEAGPCVLGAGAELKTAFCLTRGKEAFLSQHIGDLKSPPIMDFYHEALEHMQRLLETEPEAVVCDAHPDFISSRLAAKLAADNKLPLYALQHHAAHAAAVLAENNCYEPALALCLDGSGLGDDKVIWGGELIYMDLSKPEWKREGYLSPFYLPGGEAAIRQPWRIAYGLQKEATKKAIPVLPVLPADKIMDEMLASRINCPQTTSCGRLLDAFSAILGLCREITYEGQAPMRLEKEAKKWLADNSWPENLWEPVQDKSGNMEKVDTVSFFAAVMAAANTWPVSKLAAAIHYSLARALAQLAASRASVLGIKKVGLSGGVLQNSLLCRLLPRFLNEHGLDSLVHRAMPPGDGGIAFGQAVWGRQMLAKDNKEAR